MTKISFFASNALKMKLLDGGSKRIVVVYLFSSIWRNIFCGELEKISGFIVAATDQSAL
jgi:hypothetical protein